MLSEVKEGEGGLAARCGVLPFDHLLVVTAGFPGFVVEVLDRLVVEQTINRTGIGGGVVFIDGAPDIDAPVADFYCEDNVADQRNGSNHDVANVVFNKKNDQHEADFNQRGED